MITDTFLLAKKLGKLLQDKHWQCSVAESCTGGGLAAAITDVAGSSLWFDRGYITYSNQAKHEMLKVPVNLLDKYGAVSKDVVVAMANGVIIESGADCAVAISGIAGPTGGSKLKPVGTVWIAWAIREQITTATKYLFSGERSSVREQSVIIALTGLIKLIEKDHP